MGLVWLLACMLVVSLLILRFVLGVDLFVVQQPVNPIIRIAALPQVTLALVAGAVTLVLWLLALSMVWLAKVVEERRLMVFTYVVFMIGFIFDFAAS